jgi:CubicO group peptidase (beta-lactamase class C family)
LLRSLKTPVALLLLLTASCMAHADKVDDYIRQKMASQHISGLSLAVVLNGKILKAKGYGLANLELNVPATPQTIYQLASMTKQFTATAVMMLVEQGKIGLEDPVSNYLDGTPESWKNITIRHLLTHTSGIKDYINEPTQSLQLDVSEDEVYKATIPRPLNFQPGEHYAYSNTNYHLLGMIIHKLSGKPYGEFLQEHIFGPLGMKDTSIISLSDLIPNRASGYRWDGRQLHNGEYVAPSILGYAGGGIVSNVLDLAKWDAALYGERLLKSSSLQQMWTSGKLNDGSVTGYGFGWGIGETNNHKSISHGGGHRTGFTTVIKRFLNDRLTLVVLTNQSGASDPASIATGVATYFLPALLSPQPKVVNISQALLETYTGRYEIQNNQMGTVTIQNGRLLLPNGGETFELLPTSEDTFFLTDPGVDPSKKMRLIFKDAHGPTPRLIYTMDGKEFRKPAPYIGPLIHSLKPQPDPDPALTQRVWAVLQAMAQSGKALAEVPYLSPGARQDFAAVALPELAGVQSISFIAAQDVAARGIERHGGKVNRILYYKLRTDKALRYVLVYLTDEGLVTDEDVVGD